MENMKFDVKVHTAHTHTHAKRRKKSLTNHPQIAPMSAQNSPMTSFVWISQSSAIKILFDCIARSPSPVIQSSTPFFSLYNAIITVTVTDCAAGVVACEFGTGVGVKEKGRQHGNLTPQPGSVYIKELYCCCSCCCCCYRHINNTS